MGKVDPSVLIVALTGGGIYAQLLPPLPEVRRASTESATARDVHMGVVMASAALVGAGLIIGIMENDHKPVVLMFSIAVLLGAIYEVTLYQGAEVISDAATVQRSPGQRRGY